MRQRIARTFFGLLLACWPLLSQAQSQRPAPTPTVFDQPALVQRYQATITPEDLAAHLFIVASDYFEGRETTTRGQKLAAYYLASQYRKLGLEPAGTLKPDHPYAPEAYFQPFTVYGQRLQEAHLIAVQGADTLAALAFGPEQADPNGYLWLGVRPESTGELVFGGYGIADPELGYNDYAALAADSIDLVGRWLLILADEPLANDSTSLLTPDGRPSRWTTQPFLKLRRALEAGVAGVILVGDRSPQADEPLAERAARAALRARTSVGRLSLTPPQQGGFQLPPIWVVSSQVADALLAPSGRRAPTASTWKPPAASRPTPTATDSSTAGWAIATSVRSGGNGTSTTMPFTLPLRAGVRSSTERVGWPSTRPLRTGCSNSSPACTRWAPSRRRSGPAPEAAS